MIINLTQHPATASQRDAGVVDLQGDELASLKEALTFTDIPTREEISRRADFIADLALFNELGGDNEDPVFSAAMIGGAPYLMGALEAELKLRGITPLYAFTKRVVTCTEEPDGSVTKSAVFEHQGFVEVSDDA